MNKILIALLLLAGLISATTWRDEVWFFTDPLEVQNGDTLIGCQLTQREMYTHTLKNTAVLRRAPYDFDWYLPAGTAHKNIGCFTAGALPPNDSLCPNCPTCPPSTGGRRGGAFGGAFR